MRRTLALFGTLMLLIAALVMPGSVAAASSYSYQIVDQHCISGGHNIYFRVKLTAAGSTYATKLTIKSTSQYLSGGTWHDSYHWKVNKTKFVRNGDAHSIDYSYTHTDNSSPYKWRIKSELKALEGQNYLDSKTLTSKAC